MLKLYIRLFCFFVAAVLLASCRQDDFAFSESGAHGDEVIFQFEIEGLAGNTRGIMEESKTFFDVDEYIHVRAIFHEGAEDGIPRYGVYRYDGHGVWKPVDAAHTLHWPDDSKSAEFTAYYIHGSNDIFTGNPGPVKLLSDYKFDEVPLKGVATDVRYGDAVRLNMRHVFAFLTLSELQSGASNELWFYLPPSKTGNGNSSDPNDRTILNNAFALKFDPETFEMTEEFSQVPSTSYFENEDGVGSEKRGLVFIRSEQSYLIDEEKDELVPCVSFLVQPGRYHEFSLLFPRTRDIWSTYLAYTRDLESVTGPEGLLPNGRYLFSILKSLGVNIEETPDDGWDDGTPIIIIDVEAFLRAVSSGSDYYVEDPETGEKIQVLEQTTEGTKLLHNIDFQHFYYDIFENGSWRPTQTRTFDGNYHYIWNLGCPLFYSNSGMITNVGIRNASTSAKQNPIISNENLLRWGRKEDTSCNGFIACRNSGTVLNVRVIDADMEVRIQTSDPDEPTQESHNVSLLFGENTGNAYDISLAGNLKLTVGNAPGESIIPRVMIGGIAGQNTGLVSNVTYIDEAEFEAPNIEIYNTCRGTNGAYKQGGIAGLNTGRLVDIFLNSVKVDASASSGVESYLGGMVGENPYTNSGSPMISDCIVRGEIIAGEVLWVINLDPVSYAGGVAGAFNTQGYIHTSSVSVGVKGSANYDRNVDFGEGGAFGILLKTVGTIDGEIENLACYGSKIEGNGTNDYKGNFAGIVSRGYTLQRYADKNITVRQIVGQDVGLER